MQIVDKYLSVYSEYTATYGKGRVIVLMQVGSFYEMYATKTDGPDLQAVSDLLNIVLTRRDKSNTTIDQTNPMMLGFPTISLKKFLKVLLNNDYVVVVMDQSPTGSATQQQRQVSCVYTAATYIDDDDGLDKTTNYVMAIVVDEAAKKQFEVGIAMVDVSTGRTYVHELRNEYALDDLKVVCKSYRPREVVFAHDSLSSLSSSELLGHIDCQQQLYRNAPLDKIVKTIPYQRDLLHRIYVDVDKTSHALNLIFGELELDRMDTGRVALCVLLSHILENSPKCVARLHKPDRLRQDTVHLGSSTLYDLNVFSPNPSSLGLGKQTTVFQIINSTVTAMGERYLRHSLLNPIFDVSVLNESYRRIEQAIPHVAELRAHLEFNDIEKLFRRISMQSIHPLDFFTFYRNLAKGTQFLAYVAETFGDDIGTVGVDIGNLVAEIERTFDVDSLGKYVLSDIVGPIFRFGLYADIDVLVASTSSSTSFMDTLHKALRHLLNRELKLGPDIATVKLTSNSNGEHFMTLTTKRARVLQALLSRVDVIGDTGIPVSSLKFVSIGKGSTTKIFVDSMKQHSDILSENIEKLKRLNRDHFIAFLETTVQPFRCAVLDLVQKIAAWDFTASGACTATKYNYTRPILSCDTPKSHIRVDAIRHPIVELVSLEAYVPTSLEIGCDTDCILLFGLNSAGKSTLQKAVGVNILLAQIGYFVAASKFEYTPYRSLFTRINSADNVLTGQSSFAVEVGEIKSILKRSDEHTLVIADELCRGTENKSAVTIVASVIELLASKRTSLISATHIHELGSTSVVGLPNCTMKHMHIDFDEASNMLVYDRTLLPGQGEQFYGLNIAKYLMNDPAFNAVANRIRKEFAGADVRFSKYNRNLVLDKCQVCSYAPKQRSDRPLETHHIQFQKNADEYGFVDGMHKNHIANLVVLCPWCHDNVDRGLLKIDGYKETSNGKQLVYERTASTEPGSSRNDPKTWFKNLMQKKSKPSSTAQ